MGIYLREKRVVLGLDPGRDKTGFAFVDDEGDLIASGIFPSNESNRFFAAILSNSEALSEWTIEGDSHALPVIPESIAFISIGSGTHSKGFTERVRAALPCEILTVDETNTTLEARGLYWSLHAPNFWIRLIPEGLRVPARVLDDLAAWSIAVRGLKKYRDINQNRL